MIGLFPTWKEKSQGGKQGEKCHEGTNVSGKYRVDTYYFQSRIKCEWLTADCIFIIIERFVDIMES